MIGGGGVLFTIVRCVRRGSENRPISKENLGIT